MFFFFKQKTAYEMRISDWSSDVCSSDLCRILPEGNGGIRLLREAAAMARDIPVPAGDFLWDRRFRITVSGAPLEHLQVGALTAERWKGIKPDVAEPAINGQVRATLPVLFDEDGVVAAPHLGYRRTGWRGAAQAWFAPAQPLTSSEE